METGIFKTVGFNDLKYSAFHNYIGEPNLSIIDKLYVVNHELYFRYDAIAAPINLTAAAASLFWSRNAVTSTLYPSTDPNDNVDIGVGNLKCGSFTDAYVTTGIPLGELGESALDPTYTNTSIVGALNELKTQVNAVAVPLNSLVQASKELDITAVNGDGATVTITTGLDHLLSNGDIVMMEGWTGGTGVWNGVFAVTVNSATEFEYTSTGNGTATGGTGRQLVSYNHTMSDAIVEKYKCEDIVIENLSATDVTLDIGTNFGGANERQLLSFSAVPATPGETWTITFDGSTTGNLAYDADAATIQAALELLASIGAGNISVSGDYISGFTCTFTGTLARTDVAMMTADDSGLAGITISISEEVKGEADYVIASSVLCPANDIYHIAVNEIFSSSTSVSLVISSLAWGGSYIDVHVGTKRSML